MGKEAIINAKIGGSINPRWAEEVPGVAPVLNATVDLRKVVLGVVESTERTKALPPDRRALALDRLARSGKEAVKRIRELANAREAIDQARIALEDEVNATLGAVKNEPNRNFAASGIRSHIRSAGKRERRELLREALNDVEAVQAILSAPPLASGLTVDEWRAFRLEATQRYLPHVLRHSQVLESAAKYFDAGVRNAEAMVADAAGLKRSKTGEWLAEWEVDAA